MSQLYRYARRINAVFFLLYFVFFQTSSNIRDQKLKSIQNSEIEINFYIFKLLYPQFNLIAYPLLAIYTKYRLTTAFLQMYWKVILGSWTIGFCFISYYFTDTLLSLSNIILKCKKENQFLNYHELTRWV